MAEYPGAAWAGVSPNKTRRNGKVRLFIIHHYASTQEPASARARFMRSNDRSVSPNYQVNADGSVYEIVPPANYRAWTTGAVDHQAITCETQNTSGAPHWGISRASMEAIAHLIAWAAKKYGFPIQRGRVSGTSANNTVVVPGVVGHNETPAGKRTSTACPGPSMDIEWIIARARQIVGAGGSIPASRPSSTAASKKLRPGDITVNGVTVRDVQRRLVARGYSVGKHGTDNRMGDDTIAALYAFQGDEGLEKDAIVGSATWGRLKGDKPARPGVSAPPFPLPDGSFFGPEGSSARSVSGHHSHRESLRRWQQRMKDRGWDITPDGLFSARGVTDPAKSQTGRIAIAFQKEKRLRVDGKIGAVTWRAAWEEPVT